MKSTKDKNTSNNDLNPEYLPPISRLFSWSEFIGKLNDAFNYGSMYLRDKLTNLDRRRLLGSGIRRYGFIDKVSDVSSQNPDYFPKGYHSDELKNIIREIEDARIAAGVSEANTRAITNRLLVDGDRAYRKALEFYRYIQGLARGGDPKAIAMFDQLTPFFKHGRRSDQPTEHQVIKDVKALVHGKKEGEILIKNEADKITKGEKVLIDETHKKKPVAKAKVTVTEEE